MKTYKYLTKCTLFFALLSIIIFCSMPVNSQDTSLEAGKLLDMTYPFDENAIYWPTAEPFKLEKLYWGFVKGGCVDGRNKMSQ